VQQIDAKVREAGTLMRNNDHMGAKAIYVKAAEELMLLKR